MIVEGCDIKGYYLWIFIDCWLWINVYKNCYGFVLFDVEIGKCIMKKSGEFYKKMSDMNGFEYDISKLVGMKREEIING